MVEGAPALQLVLEVGPVLRLAAAGARAGERPVLQLVVEVGPVLLPVVEVGPVLQLAAAGERLVLQLVGVVVDVEEAVEIRSPGADGYSFEPST